MVTESPSSSDALASTQSLTLDKVDRCLSAALSLALRLCSLEELNFIAADSNSPTVDEIMQRVVVSDPWMADNFRAALQLMPDDMRNLFASVTGVKIDRDIRPAFFTTGTGGIYLDPEYLWVTQEQRRSISDEPDFRAGFGSQLQFVSFARYVKDGQLAWRSGNTDRDLSDVVLSLSALLFHELAHARDAFPVSAINTAEPFQTPPQLAQTVLTTTEIQGLTNPLTSVAMFNLAKVLFEGQSAEIYAIAANNILADEFERDGANDEYNYREYVVNNRSLFFEDTAMLFEEVMMKIHYDIDREIVFASSVSAPIVSCGDIEIFWSDVNRAFSPTVIDRAEFVVEQLLPDQDYTAVFDQPPRNAVNTFCQSQQAVRPSSFNPLLQPEPSAPNSEFEMQQMMRQHHHQW
ncbi:MAG: hypothetical protein HRU21_02305, partial [Pseudomonadales bacterium]|nr:hypothetical protein [Pseudomonadales bacterium]